MDIFALLLALLQGITEFLPVSSSGHLFLLEQLLNKKTLSLSFVLLVHLGTCFSVCLVFFKDIKKLFYDFIKKEQSFFYKFCISLFPSILLGLFFRSWVEESFHKKGVAFGFLISGLLLGSLFFLPIKRKSLKELTFLDAFCIGCMQALAIFPGFSRSALTITTALYCGLSARSAVLFSFLISLPVILGSSLVNIFSPSFENLKGSTLELSLSFSLSFISGIISLLIVLKLVKSDKLYLFCFYLIPLSFFVFFAL
ncbi:MAG: undecaprenyl-diphosphate phosphatase [Bdellovibrionales bacterium]|nr:undecaprenyl-diphosphate phosphatase [Bdellovibrionales bacterium]